MGSEQKAEEVGPIRRLMDAQFGGSTETAAAKLNIDLRRLRELEQALADPSPEEMKKLAESSGNQNFEIEWRKWRGGQP